MQDLHLNGSTVVGHLLISLSVDAWIITEGVTEGIGRFVGDKIEKFVDEKGKRPKAVLSICNWGCVRDKHRLIHENRRNNRIATVLHVPRNFISLLVS